MRLYRSVLALCSACATPWHADTLFGHLCWSVCRREGDSALEALLAECAAGRPPIVVSDGFPGDFLPRPLVPRHASAPAASKEDRVMRQRETKQYAHVGWLTLDGFNAVRAGRDLDPGSGHLGSAEGPHERVTTKNQIDRATGTTGEGGELFDLVEYWQPSVALYWRIADGDVPRVQAFLEDLFHAGYGKRKSVGYGQLARVPALEPFDGFAAVPDADGFVALSRFVPAPGDPTDGFWKTEVKYGKVGEEMAGDQPFKRPLLQLACGSSFRGDPACEWCGQLLSDICAHPRVRHYGFALALPMRLPERRSP